MASRAPRLVISAGAGAGKTAVLVRRVLRMTLEEGLPAEGVVAITFTRAAAGEVRERLVRAYGEAGRPDLARVARTGGAVTVDAWTQGLLRSRAAFAGIDPGFRLLDPGEADEIMGRAVREVMADVEAYGLEATAVLRELVERAGGRGFGRWEAAAAYEEAERRLRLAVGALRKGALGREATAEIHADPLRHAAGWREALVARHGAEFEVVRTSLRTGRDPILRVLDYDEPAPSELGLGRLAVAAWTLFDRLCEERGGFDGDGAAHAALRLLRERPELAASLRRAHDAVLVDEAQDLSPLQFAILEALAPPSLTLVGDARQSIYLFRDADVELFRLAESRSEVLPLTVNHRIRTPAVARAVDGTFGRVWKEGYAGIALPEGLMEEAGGVERVVVTGPSAGEKDDAVAERVAALVAEGCSPGDMLVLASRRSDLDGLARRVTALGVPVRLQGAARDFHGRLEVRDLANVLAHLADPTDRAALAATLHSPAVGLSLDGVVLILTGGVCEEPAYPAFRAWSDEIAADADRLPAHEILAEVFARSPYLENVARRPVGATTAANARKLLELARAAPELRAAEFAERLRVLRRLRSQQETETGAGEGGVLFSTVHGAKGLEADVVFVLDPYSDAMRADDVIADRAHGLVALPPSTRTVGSSLARWISHQAKARREGEAARLLYVALTRARRRLVVVVTPGSGRVTPHGRALLDVLERESRAK